jgi:hypothetical protein
MLDAESWSEPHIEWSAPADLAATTQRLSGAGELLAVWPRAPFESAPTHSTKLGDEYWIVQEGVGLASFRADAPRVFACPSHTNREVHNRLCARPPSRMASAGRRLPRFCMVANRRRDSHPSPSERGAAATGQRRVLRAGDGRPRTRPVAGRSSHLGNALRSRGQRRAGTSSDLHTTHARRGPSVAVAAGVCAVVRDSGVQPAAITELRAVGRRADFPATLPTIVRRGRSPVRRRRSSLSDHDAGHRRDAQHGSRTRLARAQPPSRP